MAFVEGGNDGGLNGVNEVTIVAAPAAATRRLVRSITIYNIDTAAVIVTLRYKHDADLRVLWKGELDIGYTLLFDDVIVVLDDTDKSITAVMSGAAATTAPDFTSAWGDAT